MRESLRAGVQIVTAPQLFPTPRALAERVAKIADVKPGHRVLEPSAGTGALLGAIGGRMFAHNPEAGAVSAVEINQSLADRLRQEFPLTHVICDDFLKCNGDLGAFDRIVMNPPFANADDIKHIKHAFACERATSDPVRQVYWAKHYVRLISLVRNSNLRGIA
jgi:tRNA1(Val) A37 N6-methylase TrmN6